MENNKKDDLSNLYQYLSYQPLVGLVVSTFLAILFFVEKRVWTVELALYIFIPIVVGVLVFIISYAILKDKHVINCSLTKGKIKYVFVSLLVLLTCFQGLLFLFYKPVTLQSVSLNEVKNISTKDNDYYIVFGAENCIYCKNMHDIYIESFTKERIKEVYYCDLSSESYDDEKLKQLDIDKIPVLIKFQNNQKVNQIVGVKKVNQIENFIKE